MWPNITNGIAWLPLLLEILDNMCIVIIWFPVGDVINFEINPSYQAVFLQGQKSKDKIEIS